MCACVVRYHRGCWSHSKGRRREKRLDDERFKTVLLLAYNGVVCQGDFFVVEIVPRSIHHQSAQPINASVLCHSSFHSSSYSTILCLLASLLISQSLFLSLSLYTKRVGLFSAGASTRPFQASCKKKKEKGTTDKGFPTSPSRACFPHDP